MKKILILILIILLGLSVYMLVFKNIEVGAWKTTNVEELKDLKEKLDSDISQAKELNEKEYASKIDDLNSSIRKLKQTKETYETKKNYLDEDENLGTIQIKEYKIEYLWAVIQNYARTENVQLKLDLIENGENNLYNLDITLRGEYQGIMNLIEHIERDDTLDFRIEEFRLVPSTVTTGGTSNDSQTNTQKNTADNNTTLQATFKIKSVKIGLD